MSLQDINKLALIHTGETSNLSFTLHLPAKLTLAMALCASFAACSANNDEAGTIRVYHPIHANKAEVEASQELARVLNIMTGQPAIVGKEPYFFSKEGYYVGNTLEGRKLLPELFANPALGEKPRTLPAFDTRPPREPSPLKPEQWDRTGWAYDNGRTAIAGTDAEATRLAASLFLQKECGARWWIPGPLGEDIPAAKKPAFKDAYKYLAAPSFPSRSLWGLGGRDGAMWNAHNMMRNHVSINHALPKILTPELARAHPDWFPSFDGKAFDATSWKGQIPHPVLTKPALMDFVAAEVCEFFDINDSALTASISLADTSLFGDLDIYADAMDERAAFRGKADLSKPVFHFYNGVAQRVAREHPERLLGALAYAFYENVPGFPVESNIIPFLTADRSQWYDKSFREEDLALVQRWAEAGPKYIGTWDYYYGSPFLVPRVMLGQVCESIPLLEEAGVDMFFAELSPRWGYDAPKAWLAAQLLWDSSQDVDALKDEFFSGYFGPAAAPMRRFFELCDSLWMNQEGKAAWIRYYADADQAVLFDEAALNSLRVLLDEAADRQMPEKYRQRIGLVSTELERTERVRKAWRAWDGVARWTPRHPIGELLAALPDYEVMRRDMHALNDELAADNPINSSGRLGYLTDDEPLAGRLALLREGLGQDKQRELARLFPSHVLELLSPSTWLCEDPFGQDLANWYVSHWPNPLIQYHVDGEDSALVVSGANSFSAQMTYSGRAFVRYSCAFEIEGQVSASSTVRLLMEFRDETGRLLAFNADRAPCGTLDGALLAVSGKAPRKTSVVRVSIIVSHQAQGDVLRIMGQTKQTPSRD